MAKAECLLNVKMPDEYRAQLIRAILGYEAKVRGISRGEALVQLLVNADAVEKYPAEIREQFARIDEQSRHRAALEAIQIA